MTKEELALAIASRLFSNNHEAYYVKKKAELILQEINKYEQSKVK